MRRNLRPLKLLVLLGAAIAPVSAQQSAPPVDPKIVLKVSTANQREFRIGETISLQLSFSSSVKNRYRINRAQYDRGGRMTYEQFVVSPAEGAVDPLPKHSFSMGGLTSFSFLGPEPWSIQLNLNEWVRFTQPGEYRLTIVSSRTSVRDPSSTYGVSAVAARSNEISLKIVAADPVWQKRVFSAAVRTLNKPAPLKAEQMEQYRTARQQAMLTLRFLETADAAREMVKRLRAETSDGLEFICFLGLKSTPERAAAQSAFAEALADPDHPIDSLFLSALRTINADPDTTSPIWRDGHERAVEQLIAALNVKRGKALSISLNTAVNEAWGSNAAPKETMDKLVSRLISVFDQLPLHDQETLLTHQWEKIASAALLPILQRYARNAPQMKDPDPYTSLRLSGSALRRWYELDPAGARPAIITEIVRPRPRFDARLLGILPDKTLPEVDFILAENFTATEDYDAASHLASLIARYATDAILPQVVEKLDPKIGTWACAIQNPLLAYLLRVDVEIARPRIERAIAARGDKFSACNQDLLKTVAELHYDPILEKIAIQSLDDPDPQVASTAATMLGQFGSPAAESPLWRRYTSWSATWLGRETELVQVFVNPSRENAYHLGLGQTLVKALATGQSWLSDKNKLQRLSEMTKVRNIQQEVASYLQHWQHEEIAIFIDSSTLPKRFYARVGHYELYSMDALKAKISQFPAETKFVLSNPTPNSTTENQSLLELRAFLAAHGSKNR